MFGARTLRHLEEWEISGTNWVVKREVVDGEVVYRVNVKEHPWLCLGCPFYQPRSRTGSKGI